MAQTITDFREFLTDAKQIAAELSELEQSEAQAREEESRLLRTLEAEKKAVTDNINQTVKRRRDEISKSYDNEISITQDRLKKTRARREKAKNQGIKDRIEEETSELHLHNRELKVRMKTLFQKEHVPAFCQSGFYYALYFSKRVERIAYSSGHADCLFSSDPLWDLFCSSGSENGLSDSDLLCLRAGIWRALYSGGKYDKRASPEGPQRGTADSECHAVQLQKDTYDHLLHKEGQE